MKEETSIHIIPETIESITDNYFTNKLNENLEIIRNSHVSRIRATFPGLKDEYDSNEVDMSQISKLQQFNYDNASNSPISMSSPSSDSDNDDCFETEYNHQNKVPLKKLTFNEVRDSIHKYYEMDDNYSNEIDIVFTFLKGQKQMFLKAVYLSQIKTHILLVPASLISIFISIFIMTDRSHLDKSFISALNAFAFFLYFINIYFQLSSSGILYTQWANQYKKLEQSIDISITPHSLQPVHSNLSVSEREHDNWCRNEMSMDIMRDIEKKLVNVNDSMTVVLPFEIKYMYPILYHTNIFAFIKRIEIYKKNLIVKFKDIKNEIRFIQWKWSDQGEGVQKEKLRLDFLFRIKEKIKGEIIHYKNAYGFMNDLMIKEMKTAEKKWFFSLSKRVGFMDNPVVSSYFATIFEND